MKLIKIALAAALCVTSLGVPAAADAQRRGDRDSSWQDRDRHDRDDGWRDGSRHRYRHHRKHRVCRTIWRHHHRERVCRWR
jgi:hypothetical protein